MKPNHTILWADDDVDDREMFREVLEGYAPDHEVVEFPNGAELLTYLRAQEPQNFPCLVVLDMNMPVLGGRETLTAIKTDSRLNDIPVAIFTTSIIPQDKCYCERFQVTMFTKPPSYPQLESAIAQLLNLCQLAQVA
ncbi:Response regulator receiver domain-containing protein [Cnuella takakiae]|uniref:Response regulator receiver domain-containing protein n=1 Tax=Cnuella takakiae TaxID=1302690 RepID=A0A1M4Z7E7_9BACT|nr:response regulator [Cnuella takakiae]OLY94305.1 hypothetical protein BUE76_22265 [Cnuella takakiae]SHF13940.1 Response regulator receiver domain-containing protein [Cnuella takakiae]